MFSHVASQLIIAYKVTRYDNLLGQSPCWRVSIFTNEVLLNDLRTHGVTRETVLLWTHTDKLMECVE